MRNNVKILRYQALAVAAIGVFIFLIAVAAGCGDDTETTGTVATATVAAECDPSSPSIIPEPGGRPQFVYFYRDTWPACQKQKPIVDELEQTYGEGIEFIRISVMEDEGDCEFTRQREAGVLPQNSVPAMMFIDADGNLVEAVNQYLNRGALDMKLRDLV